MTDTDGPLTPDDVRELGAAYREQHPDAVGRSLFVELVTPRARASIIDVLLDHPDRAMTARQIAELADISRSSFARQLDPLLELGVMERAGQVANAWTYQLNRGHPAAQLAAMLDQVLRFGTTSPLLDEQFLGTPGDDYEPGEHSADPR